MIDSKPCATCGGEISAGTCPRCVFAAALADEEELASIEEPEEIESYEFIEEIARGGMGVVWRARQRKLGREVAVKLLRGDALPGEAAARRFRIEGEAVAQLRHPNIVAVHEIGETGGRPFLSMELLGGGSLGERLKGGPLPAREAAALLAKIARAVHFAHERGVLHRDLKPANILFDDAGEPRVTDFGLARFTQQDTGLTESGATLGTPAYMPPEQAAGRNAEVTTASDVYGLGAILYETLTGRPPFQGESQLEVLRRVSEEEPKRPSTVNAHLDRDLETICLKCLEKSPSARYAGALAVAEDLARWLAGEPIRARAVTAPERLWKWARRHPAWAALWTLVTILLVGGAVGTSIYVKRLEAERTMALHRLAGEHVQAALALVEGGEWHRALLPLAEALEIGTGDAGRDRINRLRFECLVRQSPRLAALWFAGETPQHAHFTTGSNALLFMHAHSARLYDAASGAPLGPALAQEAAILSADVSSDGTRVLCGTEDGKWTLWDPRDGRVVARGEGRLRRLPPPGVTWPQSVFSDGQFVVVQGTRAQCYLSENGQPTGSPIQRNAPIRWAVLPLAGGEVLSMSEENLLRPGPDRPDIGPQYLCPPETQLMHSIATANRIDSLQADDGWCSIVQWPDHAPERESRMREAIFAQTFRSGQNWVLLVRSPHGVNLVDGWSPVTPQLFEHGASGVSGAFDAGGLTALTLASDGSSQQWDLTDNRPLGSRLHSLGAPLGVAMSGDGKSMFVRTAEAAGLWRRRPPVTAEAPPESAQTPTGTNGSLTARIGEDATVRICDARSGALLFPPLRHAAPVDGADFSPDGTLLVTRAADTVRVWESATGQPVIPPIVHPGLTATRWSPDSTALLTRGGEGWRTTSLAPGARPLAEMKALARLLSAARLMPGGEGGIVPLETSELRELWSQVGAAQPP